MKIKYSNWGCRTNMNPFETHREGNLIEGTARQWNIVTQISNSISNSVSSQNWKLNKNQRINTTNLLNLPKKAYWRNSECYASPPAKELKARKTGWDKETANWTSLISPLSTSGAGCLKNKVDTRFGIPCPSCDSVGGVFLTTPPPTQTNQTKSGNPSA